MAGLPKEGGQPRFWHNGGSIILFKINPNAGVAGRGDGPFDGHLVGGVKVEVDHRFAITVDGHIRVDFIRNIFAEFQRAAALFGGLQVKIVEAKTVADRTDKPTTAAG